ncbi:hypothetical protein Y013_26260 (plasmid) [Rhodococcus pyridinivorans SB3094]|uniref:Uncharacterized protein n=1 Tax=Rhodococcus pyridinivorans SB3094 TaxID=1435356 RepID=V9XQJ9_9NOCA|nr:hypothetical protein Y013_26260 [Rhodococcus pyridinivorans SB3094]
MVVRSDLGVVYRNDDDRVAGTDCGVIPRVNGALIECVNSGMGVGMHCYSSSDLYEGSSGRNDLRGGRQGSGEVDSDLRRAHDPQRPLMLRPQFLFGQVDDPIAAVDHYQLRAVPKPFSH